MLWLKFLPVGYCMRYFDSLGFAILGNQIRVGLISSLVHRIEYVLFSLAKLMIQPSLPIPCADKRPNLMGLLCQSVELWF